MMNKATIHKTTMSSEIHIILVHPKMPSNTGNIIRLCANTGANLHLLKPLGFELDDKKLRRAGLDYHEYARLKVYENWEDLKSHLDDINCQHVVALTTKFSQPFYDYTFNSHLTRNPENHHSESNHIGSNKIALVFGSETDGLPETIRQSIGEKNWLRLPMLPDSRSLNLSNSVAICLYEVWRQLGFVGDIGESVGYDVIQKTEN